VAAHVYRACVADELQFWSGKCFRKHSVDDGDNRRGRGRNRDRNHGASGRPVFLVYMSNGIKVFVVMDSRTVLMIAVLRVVRRCVYVERERLHLQREERRAHQDDRTPATHGPSLLEPCPRVNGARSY
jgi:hypothetical protein